MIKATDKNITELPSQKKKERKIKTESSVEKIQRIEDLKSKPKVPARTVKKTVKVLLNGRSGPSYDAAVVEIYSAGTELEIIEIVNNKNEDWGKTTKETYVNLKFVE